MKASLYVTSIQTFSGKTAICLGLGRRMQTDGYKVGYFKPLGMLPREVSAGVYSDEDALFAQQVLNLAESPQILSPVCLTPQLLEAELSGTHRDLTTDIIEAYNVVRQDKDVLVLEGGASLREGYAVGLSTPKVARMLGAPVLAVVKYENDVRVVDDALSAHARLGDQLIGIVMNHVPSESLRFAREVAAPALERQRINVFGILPEESQLLATSIAEIAEAADGKFLCHVDRSDELVENLAVGAMTIDEARTRLRQIASKAVITGGDRTDMIETALDTFAKAIILTGGLKPEPAVLKRAEDLGVAVVLVPHDTLTTVKRIEQFFGKSRLAQRAKLARLVALLGQHFDFKRLYQRLGL